jgi:hypothetical protein
LLATLSTILAAVAFGETAPEIAFDSTPDFFKLPDGIYFGDVAGIAVNSKKHVFVLSRGNTSGPAYGAAGNMHPGSPWALCITPGPVQYLYVSDGYPGRIYKLSLDGKVLGWLGGTGKTLKKFGWVHEIACPSENEIYVAELLNWRAQKLTLHP